MLVLWARGDDARPLTVARQAPPRRPAPRGDLPARGVAPYAPPVDERELLWSLHLRSLTLAPFSNREVARSVAPIGC
ncbi:hypothetical protein GCM10027064_18110 [Microbacterium petrolearium]